MENYEKLLDGAYKEIKPITGKSERFEIPKIQGHLEGNKTILTNFQQISSYIRRDINHFLKFILRELATSGVIRVQEARYRAYKGTRVFFCSLFSLWS